MRYITDSLVCDLDQVTQFILDFNFPVCEIRVGPNLGFFGVYHNQNAVNFLSDEVWDIEVDKYVVKYFML